MRLLPPILVLRVLVNLNNGRLGVILGKRQVPHLFQRGLPFLLIFLVLLLGGIRFFTRWQFGCYLTSSVELGDDLQRLQFFIGVTLER